MGPFGFHFGTISEFLSLRTTHHPVIFFSDSGIFFNITNS